MSKIFRVFVSSTFSDLKLERDALHLQVFPRLREFCSQHGARFQAIDLRWGVSQEASRDQQTMNICLGEIESCQQITPRPNFIVLLGDRYGWRPPPPQIPAEEYEGIYKICIPEEKVLLDDWYRRDDNAVSPEYVIQPWDAYSYEQWAEIERELHGTLEHRAKSAGLNPQALFKYWASATHQEIAAGALQVEDAADHVFAFFRQINGLPENNQASEYVDLDETGNPDSDARDRLTELKAALEGALTQNVRHYDAHWTNEGPSRGHIEQLCEDVFQSLKGVIENQIAGLEEVDPLEAEIAAHAAFAQDRARFFTGRSTILKIVGQYVQQDDAYPLVIWGAPGSGKSAVMARSASLRQLSWPHIKVIRRFIGASPGSMNTTGLLKGICQQIYLEYDFESLKQRKIAPYKTKLQTKNWLAELEIANVEAEFALSGGLHELSAAFLRFIKWVPEDQKLVIFIDALDQLSYTNIAVDLSWLSIQLPLNVRLIISTTSGEVLQQLSTWYPRDVFIELDPMPLQDAGLLLDMWLEDANRVLQPHQRMEVLDKFTASPQPLYLKMAFEEARRWKSYTPSERACLSTGVDGIIQDLFARLSAEAQHGEVLVNKSLGYLAVAKHGLTEDELLDVLAMDMEVYTWFLHNQFHIPSDLIEYARQYLEEITTKPSPEQDETLNLLDYARRLLGKKKPISSTEHAIQDDALVAETWLKEICLGKDEQPIREFLSKVMSEGKVLRLPVVLWSRLFFDLEQYLTTRAADGTTTLGFFHRQLEQAVVRDIIPGEIKIAHHRALASYFSSAPSELLALDSAQPNLRKFSELPYQLALGELWDEVQKKLLDINFLQAKLNALGPQPLIDDFQHAYQAGYHESDLSLLQNAIQISAHALAEDPLLLWSQLYDRLRNAKQPAIQDMLAKPPSKPWLRPVKPVLLPVGGPLVRTLSAHQDHIDSVQITADGRFAVSTANGIYDRSLRVWDVQTGENIHTLKIGFAKVLGCHPDGERVFFRSAGTSLAILDVRSGQIINHNIHNPIQGQVKTITPDGRLAVSNMRDETLQIWEVETGKAVQVLSGYYGGEVVISPDGHWVIAFSLDRVKIWDVRTGLEHAPLKGKLRASEAVAITPDSQRVIIADTFTSLFICDIHTGEILKELIGHKGRARDLVISPDGRMLLSASLDHTIRVWDMEKGENLGILEGHTDSVNSVSMSKDALTAVSGSTDKTLKVWDLESLNMYREDQVIQGRITGLVVTPRGDEIISTHQNGRLILWDSTTGEKHLEFKIGFGRSVACVTPDGCFALILEADRIGILKLATGEEIQKIFSRHHRRVKVLDLAADGSYFVSAPGEISSHKEILLWRVNLGSADSSHIQHPYIDKRLHFLEDDISIGTIHAVKVSQDGKYIVSTSSDDVIRVWDLETGELLKSLRGHTHGNLKSIELSHDGCYAVSGDSFNNILKVWHLPTGQCLYTLNEYVPPGLITPDGTGLVVVAKDGGISLLDLASGKNLVSYESSRGSIRNLYLSPFADFLMAQLGNHTVRVWEVGSGKKFISFRFDDQVKYLQLAWKSRMIVVGEKERIHFLQLVNLP